MIRKVLEKARGWQIRQAIIQSGHMGLRNKRYSIHFGTKPSLTLTQPA